MEREGLKKGILCACVFLIIAGVLHFGATSAAAVEKGTFRAAIHWAPSRDWVDPAISGFLGSGFFMLYMFHDALLKPMPDKTYSPCLAESWTFNADSTVYDFKLREGVKFHNGDEMTAEDVVFSFERYKGGASALLKGRINKLEAVSRYHFRVTFKEPFVNFLDFFLPGASTIGFVVPKKYIEEVGDDGFRRNPIGCGPFKFVEYHVGEKIVGDAFEDFWRGKPKVKRIEIYPVKEVATRYTMVLRGEVDLATTMHEEFYKKVEETPELRVIRRASPAIWFIFMTTQWDPKSPWSDIRVREAASLAIDRQALVEVHMPGGKPVGTIGLEGDPERLPRDPDAVNRERAKKLLAEAGYPNGFDGGTFIPTDGGYWAYGEQVANDLRGIGIKTKIVLLERMAQRAQRAAGKFKGATFIDSAIHPTTSGRLIYALDPLYFSGYPDVRTLMDKFNKSLDRTERTKLIKDVQKLLYEKRAFIYLTRGGQPAAVGPRVKGNPWKVREPFPMFFPCPMELYELNE